MSTPKIVSESKITVKGNRRTAEKNRRRNELEAQRMRDELDGKMPAYIAGLSRALSSEDARQRSDYLDSLIRKATNL
jgi:hypothetical protein